MGNYKLKPNMISDFSCSGCSSFDDYLTKAGLSTDSEGYLDLDELTTNRGVDPTWGANNLSPRYQSEYTTDSRALYNRFFLSDVLDETFIGRATINAFTINDTSPTIILNGTVPTFRIGFDFQPSADYYYAIKRTPTELKVWTLNQGNNTVNTAVTLIRVHINADLSGSTSQDVNNITLTQRDYGGVIPFRMGVYGSGAGGAGSNARYLRSGGGGGGGSTFGGLLDFLACDTYHIYVGSRGTPGETGGTGGATQIYTIPASGSPEKIASGGGGKGGGVEKAGDGAAMALNSLPWGLMFTNTTSGVQLRFNWQTIGKDGGKHHTAGQSWSPGYGEFHFMPGRSMWAFSGYSLSKREGGESSNNSGGGGGASPWSDGGDCSYGWSYNLYKSDAGTGAGGGGMCYQGGTTGDEKRGGYGGHGFVSIFG